MTRTLSLELNIALIPEPVLGDKLTTLSQILAKRYPSLVRLGPGSRRLSLAPHLTLYQASLPLDCIVEADQRLTVLARNFASMTLAATTYAYNAEEASFEVQREKTQQLINLQQAAIDALNPLRGGLLLERDPAGNVVHDLLDQPGELGENIRRTGYGEVGGLFRPHDTTNWFELGTAIDLADPALPELSTLVGEYHSIGVFLLGPYGTCPQLLREYRL